MTYEFVIPGKPRAWMRVKRGANGQAYDPPENRAAKDQVAWLARAAGVRPMDGPVRLWMNFMFRRPKSHLRKDGGLRSTAPEKHTIDPDTSNLVKMVEDGLIGVAYRDDCQVCAIHAEKVWVTDTDSMTVVVIEPDKEDD